MAISTLSISSTFEAHLHDGFGSGGMGMTRKVRAVTYCRVSRFDQDPDLQVHETKRLVRTRRWTLVGTYSDQGVSGSKTSRPGLDRMMADARAGKFDVLVVWRSDRLFRSLKEMLTTIDQLTSWGIDYVSVTEVISTRDAQGKLLMAILGAMAEFERSLLIERTKAGIEASRRRGKRPGRPRVHVDLCTAKRLRGQGWSYKKIAKKLGIGQATLSRAFKADEEQT